MSWYKVVITASQAAHGEHGELQDEFVKIFSSLGGPKDMALFSSGWSRSKTFNIYFTPGCASHPTMNSFVDSCGAVPCDEPTSKTESVLALLVGDSVQWDEHIWSPNLEN